jgi:K+-transporting ATPase ATPase C chain
MTLALTVLTGLIYPGLVTGLSQLIFPKQANGSLIQKDGHVVGSSLIGQNFTRPEYFHATASGGSNFGPTSQKLVDRTKASVEKFRKENPEYTGPLPADLLTASASGLDPHVSPASATAQIARVARARGVAADQVEALVAQFTEGRDLGFLGEPRVNVLTLNMALDEKYPARK